MIEPEDYKLPHKRKSNEEPTKEEKRAAEETLEYLESLPFRPFGIDW